ncbi:putative calcium-transporting ATPase 13, plasma membrane-type isoform X2 [Salvia hispanica]|uniref:putative calcium-transporting ATPase 13, plasma membrane-type isoform X2 n=1 Tax=Salvia hispanica TaxID=49212 RepID=UPI002009857B|nr:putative calcium-transporting ATPase 13, plasma membrane-type isoform X2 [Salvia hispanica]
MSEIMIKAKSGCMELVHLHGSSNLNKKMWHNTFLTIYCSRAFLSPPSTIAIDHHLEGPQGVATALNSDPHDGITGDEQAFGTNTYPSPPPNKTFLHFTLTPFKDPSNLLLLACAAISLAIGINVPRCRQGLYDGATIFFLVFLIISISAVINFTQSRRLPKLTSNVLVQVVRSSTGEEVPIHDVVVGDIVFLNTGDQVPADGLFLDGHSLRVESEIKSSANHFRFSGTKVAEGYGKMLVTGVRMNTLLGEMMRRIAGVTEQATTLQSSLNKLASSMLKLGLAADFLVLVVWVIRYFTEYAQDDNGEKEFNWSRTKAVDVINSAIGIVAAVIIAVVATPERSPLALTLTLAYSMKRMMAEFRNYTDEERMERSSPFDKILMVQCLKTKDHVVAVTGDGTNDAPPLKEADIGLSMGIQGTEVYNNIQKFIQFQLTVNITALAVNFVAAVSAGEVPLTAVQLLWVNLIIDTLAALALARELMEPVGRDEALISNVMWRNLMAQAVYQIVVLLVLQFRGEGLLGVSEKVKNTLIFNAFVMCQVFNKFNARKLEKRNVFEGLQKNKMFVGIVGVTLVLQALMVQLLNKFADTEKLSLEEWGICVGIGALSWPIAWLVKLIPWEIIIQRGMTV